LDGVIPYDPPQNPPATPPSSGTSFTLASCQYPAGFIDEPVAYRSYDRIVARLDASVGIKPRFSLFVGDQVYVDPTAGLYDPAAKDDHYRVPYEVWLRQQNVRGVLRRIPSFMLLDDHEIDDNWEPVASPDEKENDDKKQDGVKAYKQYQRGKSGGLETFDFDGFHFFMLDTRTERMHRKVDGSLASANLFDSDPLDPSKTMGRLKKWLREKPAPKFVVSPAMLLPRHRRAVQRNSSLAPTNLSALHSDGWDGYPNTLREVLAYIAREKINGVVFWSGRRASRLRSDGRSVRCGRYPDYPSAFPSHRRSLRALPVRKQPRRGYRRERDDRYRRSPLRELPVRREHDAAACRRRRDILARAPGRHGLETRLRVCRWGGADAHALIRSAPRGGHRC